MMIPAGPHNIDDLLTFTVTTHRFDTGALTDADAVPSFRVYEDETGTAILTGSMAKLDDTNTTGFYSEQLTLSAANGFEVGKSYAVYVTAAVNAVTGGQAGSFKVVAPLATAAAVATLATYVDTEVAAIKAKTDNLPTDPADASDIAASFSTVNATLATISGKTTNLPADPADASDIAAAFATVNGTLATINAKTTNLPAAPAATGDAMTLTAGERTASADALLNRDMSAVTVSNSRSPINALRILRNKVSVPLGIVYAENDSTTAWSFTTTTDAAALPIVTVDPA